MFAEAMEARGTDWAAIGALYTTLHKGGFWVQNCPPSAAPVLSPTALPYTLVYGLLTYAASIGAWLVPCIPRAQGCIAFSTLDGLFSG
jgi:hypothetical protein